MNRVGDIKQDNEGGYMMYLGEAGWIAISKAELFNIFSNTTRQMCGLTEGYREWRNSKQKGGGGNDGKDE